MNKRQRNKRAKTLFVRFNKRVLDPDVMRQLGEIGASFIRAKLRQPTLSTPRTIRSAGHHRDASGIVHAVDALSLASSDGIDLGRETACEAISWNPDAPEAYPALTEDEVDCMACIRQRGS